MFKLLVAAFCFLFVISCTQNRASQEPAAAAKAETSGTDIVGGFNAQSIDPITQVTVKLIFAKSMRSEKDDGCTGTLISPNHILTAGHCVAGNKVAQITFPDGTTSTTIEGMYVHPQFSPNAPDNRYDFAILKFSKETPVTVYAQLATSQTEPQNGQASSIAGFGITTPTGSDFGVLRTLNVQIQNMEYSNVEGEISEGADSGACHGDSGGPAYIEEGNQVIVWGVDALNSADAKTDCLGYELYSRVSVVSNWVEEAMSF